MASTVLQVRIDDSLKKSAAELYKGLGLDLSSAIKLFLNRSLEEGGLPFSMNAKKEENTFDVTSFLSNYVSN